LIGSVFILHKCFIRKAELGDIKGIMNIHRNCDDPWHEEHECRAWIEERLKSGFYIQVAQIDDKIIGHGEWIISEEPNQKILYLGLLQVDEDYQKMGVGRAMIADGEKNAQKFSCSKIVTIPDNDTNSIVFYEKCGFAKFRTIKSCSIATSMHKDFFHQRMIVDAVPFSVVSELPFIFGLSQCASRHMWEVCNNKPCTDDSRMTPACLCNGSYIQFSYYEPNNTALALCWSKSNDLSDVIKKILYFGYECGLKNVNFVFFEELEILFKGLNTELSIIEIAKLL
jgi:predicted N-acetyltransferase YhbS